ncbi:hypothetical protein GIB67_006478 [Kingdonia uniflora]|uniref:Uncharacterized protein n=1 Tax=Kingdonia uniflora TaxID=39325 RepID=A0A7J7LEH4_9MAGN|nr:hypothetical protein GIB67_006478 [Kingdonia uniflora]
MTNSPPNNNNNKKNGRNNNENNTLPLPQVHRDLFKVEKKLAQLKQMMNIEPKWVELYHRNCRPGSCFKLDIMTYCLLEYQPERVKVVFKCDE